MNLHHWPSWLIGLLVGCLIMPTDRAAAVDYEADILPILKQQCIDCHGPDVSEAGLRLDSMLHALQGGDSGEAAIIPGESVRSYLFARITHADPSKRMPPDTAPLSNDQIGFLQKWIDQSATWDSATAELARRTTEHWSFEPLRRVDIPSIGGDQRHPIDALVVAQLSDVGLTASPTADRQTLIRRLFFVMHGMPPTPTEVARFTSEDSDLAWESLVDRVLASARYGQRWATHWLDLVRFGETTGFETNRERPNAWYYRDWVVDALNSDKPYDQFIIEQLAGDAIGQDVATGFLVAGPNDIVKGRDPLLGLTQRQDELADIINTTGTTFLGLTIGCARCHNHKFDPISQTDYYAMQAIFAGVFHGERALPIDPANEQRIAAIDRKIETLKQQLQPFTAPPNRSAGAVSEAKELREPVNARENVEFFQPVQARFVRFTVHATNRGEPCIDELEIYSGDQNVGLASSGAQSTSSGDFIHPLHKLVHINDGKHGNARSWIADKTSGGWVQIELAEAYTIDRIKWGRDRTGRYADRLAIDYRIEASVDGRAWTMLCSSADRQRRSVVNPKDPLYDFDAFPIEEARRGEKLQEELQSLVAQRERWSAPTMVYAGKFTQPDPTHRLYRGDPLSPREAVAPAAIKSLTPLSLSADSSEQERRLALARWIADPGNPLTARVIVNRLWQFHFGTGLVDTPSDFGSSGTLPTHPDLLDYLAVELIDSGWSLKHLQRLILTSATWRQSSKPRDEAIAIDATSRLLWRFPPRRLEAEAIRDSVLAVTGKLDSRIGGAGFSGFEVEPENVRHYFPKKSYGPEDWRRMLYMTKVRQERDSVFGVFDCPDFNQVVPQRTRSTTPLQALNLLNSPFLVQQAFFLAERLNAEAANAEAKVELAFRLCFGRDPLPGEVQVSLDFVSATNWQAFGRAMLNANEFVFIP